VTLWLGPNSASYTGAYAEAVYGAGDSAGSVEYGYVTLVKSVTLAATTSVYLNIECAEACTVDFEGPNAIGSASGLTALFYNSTT
jgi:hypothetical protein